MLNQHNDHSSYNPANQSESDLPSWDSIMDKLTPEENEVIYSELYDIKAKHKKELNTANETLLLLKKLQLQVDAIQKEQEGLNPFTSGLTKEELDAKWAKLYTKRANLEEQIRTIILNTK